MRTSPGSAVEDSWQRVSDHTPLSAMRERAKRFDESREPLGVKREG